MTNRTAAAVRRPRGFRLLVRRIWAHLSRRSAAWAYSLVVLCALIYNFVPKEWAVADTVREFVLILASVAVGAIVLPELPSNLWSIDVERVRNLVPGAQRKKLAQALISSESWDDRWNRLVWANGLDPLLKASRHPWQYVRDMDYDVDVHLGQSVVLASTKTAVSSVTVEQKSTRVLARDGAEDLFLSIARTDAALGMEFKEASCLGRELVPLGELSGADWQQAVRANCNAELVVDGQRIELEIEALEEFPDVVRWRTPASFELPDYWVSVQMRFDFPLDPSVDTFPVYFSGYYCAGTTDISLRLYDEKQPSALVCHYFVGRALDKVRPPEPETRDSLMFKQQTFSTGRDGLLWPGTGVLFSWKPTA